MAAWRRAIELSLGDAEVEKLRSIAQSRTEPANRVERARILLAYREDPSFMRWGKRLDCITKRSSAVSNGPWLRGRCRHWTIAFILARSRPSPWRPRLGLFRWHAGRPRNWVTRTNWGRGGFCPPRA